LASSVGEGDKTSPRFGGGKNYVIMPYRFWFAYVLKPQNEPRAALNDNRSSPEGRNFRIAFHVGRSPSRGL